MTTVIPFIGHPLAKKPTALSLDWVALALMVPVFASGVLFNTYDVSLPSLGAEVARQLNLPFLLAEMAMIALAMARKFRPSAIFASMDRFERAAVVVFLSLYWIGGAFQSQAAGFATIFNLTYLVHPVFAFAVAHCVSAPARKGTEAFAMLVAISLSVFAIAIAIQFMRPPAGRAVTDIVWQFALPGFISVRLFGAMLAPFLVLATWLALRRPRASEVPVWNLAACAIFMGMLVWSGTRAGLVGFGAAGLIAFTVFRLKLHLQQVAATCAAFGAGAVSGLLLAPYGDPAFYLFVPSDIQSGAEGISGGRLSFWVATWEAYLPVKWFGAGPGATAWILPPEQWPHVQPHNIVLQFLLNWGLIAALAALYLLSRMTVSLHRRAIRVPAAIPFVLMFDSILVMSLFDGTLHFAQHTMIAAASAGIAFARGRGGT